MRRDDRVFLMGEEVAEYNGAYKVSQGMLAEFGAAGYGENGTVRAEFWMQRGMAGAGLAYARGRFSGRSLTTPEERLGSG